MDKISITLTNCHGIKKFDHKFNFKRKGVKNTNISLIYAPNGIMKTSFAKTLRDIGNNKNPQNQINGQPPKYTIKIYDDDNDPFEIKHDSSETDKKKVKKGSL